MALNRTLGAILGLPLTAFCHLAGSSGFICQSPLSSLALALSRMTYFQGETDIDQLALVIKSLGTPSEENWPGHAQLPDFNKITFAPSRPQPWDVLVPGMPSSAQNLTKEFVKYDSSRRIRPHEVTVGISIVHVGTQLCVLCLELNLLKLISIFFFLFFLGVKPQILQFTS